MKIRTFAFCALTFGAALIGTVSEAEASGIVVDASALQPAQRSSLETEIANHRDQFPEVHEAVFNVQSVHPHVYKHFRNAIPMAGRELRALGAEALLPMLDALAFNAPDRNGLEDHEWEAYQTGLLEAVGLLGDARSIPVLESAFEQRAGSDAVAVAAATALGRVGAFDSLRSRSGEKDPLRAAAIQGLGQVRSVDSVKLLSDLLGTAKTAADTDEIAKALGNASSSWAWKAMGPEAEADGDVARELAARAMMKSFTQQPASRATLKRTIVMTEHPVTLKLISDARFLLDQEGIKELDQLEQRFNRARARR